MALRAELELLIAKDLLGPAGAEDEELARELNSPRDRYLLGMLAPKTQRLRASQMDLLGEGGDGGGEDGKDDEAGLPTDSLMPNSIGLTATVAGDAKALTLTAGWGQYLRIKSDTATTATGQPALVWKRAPRGAAAVPLALAEGEVAPIVIDSAQPLVVVRGEIRRMGEDWLVSLFLVNNQVEPEKNKDEAWVFQPELELAGVAGAAVFKRRHWLVDDSAMDPAWRREQRMLAMMYRHRC